METEVGGAICVYIRGTVRTSRDSAASSKTLHSRRDASKMVPVLVLLMVALVAADEPMMDLSEPAESVIHCDSSTLCPDGTTCCRSPFGVWYCCPFSMGQCCRDGVHCCRHGYHCDSTSTHCLRGWISMPSVPKLATKAIQTPQALKWQSQTEKFHCDGDVYCPTEQFCCKSADGQWGCCNEMAL